MEDKLAEFRAALQRLEELMPSLGTRQLKILGRSLLEKIPEDINTDLYFSIKQEVVSLLYDFQFADLPAAQLRIQTLWTILDNIKE
ncbi:hypothetical protein KY329_04315 [Candidatus Woesearchaeota archaeon]|nr:hypothetical protein [Candidatus Woesearchaeota archaeon]